MAGYRTYILVIILSAALAVAFFALPNSSAPASDTFERLLHYVLVIFISLRSSV